MKCQFQFSSWQFIFSFILINFCDIIRGEECLKNVIVVRTEERSVSMAWDYACDHHDVLYKVYLEHREWKACKNGQKDTSRGPGLRDLEVRGETSVDIDGLHPYSLYKVTVKAIVMSSTRRPEEETEVAETKESAPEVTPAESSVKPYATSDSIRFFWRSPLPSECRKFNGEISGYHYTFRATSPWATELGEMDGDVSDDETSKEFENLLPFTSYSLKVYTKTSGGMFNAEKSLTLNERTLGNNRLEAPTDLKVERKNSEIIISWLPSYPPTSEVESYKIRWKSEKTEFPDIDFLPENSVCDRESNSEGRLCVSITQSVESFKTANLTFSVQAIGPGGLVTSPWSSNVMFYPSGGDASDDLVTIIVISVVAFLFLVLILTGISYRCRQRMKRYKNVPDYESGRRRISFISQSGISGPAPTMSPPPPPGYPPSPTGSSLPGFPAEPTSTETAMTVLSSIQGRSLTLSHPIILPTAAPSRPGRLTSTLPKGRGTTKIDTSKYQHLLLPAPLVNNQQIKRPTGSIQETPLPPVPIVKPKEPIYEELCNDTMLSRRRFKSNNDIRMDQPSAPSTLRRKSVENEIPMSTFVDFRVSTSSSKIQLEDEGEEFLKPVSGQESHLADDEDYLQPRTGFHTSKSFDEEYLKPTFGRFDRINSRDLSPPTEKPPPIPMQSYTPLKSS